jgi:hypothetical protein
MRYVQITGVLKKDPFDKRNLGERLRDYALWRWYSAVRAAQNPAQWWRRRQRARQINQYLLNEASKYRKSNQGTQK